MSLIAVHRATSSLLRLTLAAALALPSTGAMPAGAVPVDGVVYGCPMGGHTSGMRGMHAAGARADATHGRAQPGPAGDDGDGCHCCRECGCPAAPEAAVPPVIDAGRVPAIIGVAAAAALVALAPRAAPPTLLPPATGPPAFFA